MSSTKFKSRRNRTPSAVLDEMELLHPDMTRKEIIEAINKNHIVICGEVGALKAAYLQTKADEEQKQKELADKLLNGGK